MLLSYYAEPLSKDVHEPEAEDEPDEMKAMAAEVIMYLAQIRRIPVTNL